MNPNAADPLIQAAAAKMSGETLFALAMVLVIGAVAYMLFRALDKSREAQADSERRFSEVIDRVATSSEASMRVLSENVRENTKALTALQVALAARGVKNV